MAADDTAVDDAWIVARVARNLVQGQGPWFDPSAGRAEAVTSPLWLLLACPPAALGLDPVPWLRALGIAAGAGAAFRWVRAIQRRAPDPARAGLATGVALVSLPSLGWHLQSGLETGLWLLVVTLLAEATLSARPPGRWALGAALVRPEALLTLAAGTPARAAVGLAVGAAGVWLALRAPFIETVLPTTFWAKSPDPWRSAQASLGAVLGFGLVPIALALRPPLTRLALALLLAAWIGGVDWMPGYRRALPLGWLAAGAVGRVADRRLQGLGAGAAALAGLAAWAGGEDQARYFHAHGADLGRRAAAQAGVARVAAFDIGRLGWTFPGSVHDLAGLTDPRIAAAPGGHGQKPFDVAWFQARAPDLVVLTSATPPAEGLSLISAEQQVLDHLRSDPRWRFAGHRPVDGHWMLLFARQDLTFDPDVWRGWTEGDFLPAP